MQLIPMIISADVNECAVRNGGCSHYCINKPGTYHCFCQSGFQLLADNRTCEGKDLQYIQFNVQMKIAKSAVCKLSVNWYS